ncbi:hypothetical protein DB346_24685 [Verrucomicrobia bacterium LW23]|nr:hypothetical protein DB346_24685 [Verrucomicrobia bacterium LW23]
MIFSRPTTSAPAEDGPVQDVSGNLPATMRALVLPAHNRDLAAALDSLRVEERPLPEPGPGQVLVRIEAAGCNPSDLTCLQGLYPVPAAPPLVPGFEGAGVVVRAGASWLGSWLLGRRVACGGGFTVGGGGTWAEYCLTDAEACIPLSREMSLEQGASLIVNPLTAMGLLDMARRGGHRAIVQNAAGGQVGTMLARLCADARVPLINVVRRTLQAEEMRAAGQHIVLDSSSPDFAAELRDTCRRYEASIAFDAVGGTATALLFDALPAGGTVVVYGALDAELCGGISPYDVVFQRKSLQGFYLPQYLKEQGPLRLRDMSHKAQRLILRGRLSTQVRERVTLVEFPEAIKRYAAAMSWGKVILVPGRNSSLAFKAPPNPVY